MGDQQDPVPCVSHDILKLLLHTEAGSFLHRGGRVGGYGPGICFPKGSREVTLVI